MDKQPALNSNHERCEESCNAAVGEYNHQDSALQLISQVTGPPAVASDFVDTILQVRLQYKYPVALKTWVKEG